MAASVKVANGMATTNRLDALRLRLVAGETAERVGQRIRARRRHLGLNQRQLADRIPNDAVNNQRVSDWERGVHQPSERHLMQLAEALDVDVAYFYASDEQPAPLLNVLNGSGEGATPVGDLLARLAALEEQVLLLRAEIAAADAEALKRNEAVLRAIRESP